MKGNYSAGSVTEEEMKMSLDEKIDFLDREIRLLHKFCVESGYSPRQIENSAEPFISASKSSIRRRWLRMLMGLSVIVAIFSALVYCDPVYRLMIATGRRASIKVLPYWDWTKYWEQECLIDNPLFNDAEELTEKDCDPIPIFLPVMPNQCGCCKHHLNASGKPFSIYKISSRKFRKDVIEWLVQHGYLSPRASSLCTACAAIAERAIGLDSSTSDKKIKIDYIGLTIEELENGTMSNTDKLRLSNSLGKSIQNDLFEFSLQYTKEYTDVETFDDINFYQLVQKHNDVLVSFLMSACNLNTDSNNKKYACLLRTLEQVMYLRNCRIVTPLSFSGNLLAYFYTGSKTACTLHGYLNPSGSYTTILNWLKNTTNTRLLCPDKGDIITFFDNNQVVPQSWRIKFDYKTVCSIITNIIHILPSVNSRLQFNPALSPIQWSNFNYSDLNMHDNINKIEVSANDLFRQYRENFISSRLNEVFEDNVSINNKISDSVDSFDCEYKFGEHETFKKSTDPYGDIPSKHPDKPAQVLMGEPGLFNPNSYVNVEKAMDHIANEVNLRSKRSWTILGCDGLPYILCSRLREKLFICPLCSTEIKSGLADFQTHIQNDHDPTNVNELQHRKFGNILLIPGPGHFEINMVKAVFKLGWHVLFYSMAKLMGFRSDRALSYCQSATSHHKSWQLLLTCLYGTADELLLPYCRQCLTSRQKPSTSGYFKWASSVKNPNYKFCMEFVFTYILAVYLYRSGIRKNNSEFILAGRTKFAPLYYGLNMISYQEIEIRDLSNRVQCPDSVSDFLKANESFSVSGHYSKGEGGDFILESRNRKTKMFMPPGIPTESQWLRSCRNVDRLEKVCREMKSLLRVDNITVDMFTEETLTNDMPIIVTDGLRGLPEEQRLTIQKLTDIYKTHPVLKEYVGCSFRSNKKSVKHGNHKIFLQQLSKNRDQGFVAHWENCLKEPAKAFREFYKRPYFLPELVQISDTNWVFISSFFEMREESIEMPIEMPLVIIIQVKGEMEISLFPRPPCDDKKCTEIIELLSEGEIMVVPLADFLWTLEYRTIPRKENIAIGIGGTFDK